MNARNSVFEAADKPVAPDIPAQAVAWLAQAQQAQMGLGQLFECAEQLQAAGQQPLVLQLYDVWLAHTQDPNKHMASFNHGSMLQSMGMTEQAQSAYRQCVQWAPRFGQAYINLGLIYEKKGLRDQAVETWSTLVGMRLLKDPPANDMLVMALNHIGRVHEDQRQYALAEQAMAQSLALNPKQKGVIQHWAHIRQKSCKWPVFKPLPGISPHEMLMATSPLAMLSMSDDPVQQLLTAHAFVERTYSFSQEYLSKGRQYRHERLRVGYVSGDLCVHAVGLLLPELLEHHDRSKFDIYAYDFSPEDGTAHRQRLKNAFSHWRSIHSMKDREVAELVLTDEIDILIDLHGLSAGARPGIFALHPALTQGTYLGFIGTTGMPWFDFVITDAYALPPALEPYFTEKPLHVDGSFIPINADPEPVVPVQRAEFGLPDKAFVMTSFGNVYKINPEMFACWMRLLRRIPNSILWLMDDNPRTTESLKAEAQKHGMAADRLVFATRSAHSQYRAKLALSDVFLDNYPYNCGSTTRDVLNAGVPLVTLSGKTMVSRMGGSILTALNLTQWIAQDLQTYEDKVVALSQDGEQLGLIKKELGLRIANAHQQPKRLTRSIEKGLLAFHRQNQEREL
jgi:predicted O-linked N-acetylglucosamine transferase (SPINDLY family)